MPEQAAVQHDKHDTPARAGQTPAPPVDAPAATPDAAAPGGGAAALLGRVDSASREQIIDLMQQQHGNQFVQRVLQDQAVTARPSRTWTVQRVPVTAPNAPETLQQPYDDTNAPTQDYRPHSYGGGSVNYDMTRSDTAVNVNVRIRFVRRVNPTDTASEIPEGPTRDFARNTCRDLVGFWNDKFVLLGHLRGSTSGAPPPTPTPAPTPAPATPAPASGVTPPPAPVAGEIRLRIVFAATPVFTLGGEAHKTIALHDEVTADGSALLSTQPTVPGQPRSRRIDSGNWFTSKNNAVYPAGFNSIYAHEYGHLLGIPDEYSLSNPDMHVLMHNISPQSETAMNNQLDRAGIREMVLAAIGPRMQPLVQNLSNEVSASIAAQHAKIEQEIARGLRQAWGQAALVNAVAARIRTQLEAAGQTHAAPMAHEVVRFEGHDNLSNISIAQRVVPGELDPAHIRTLLSSVFSQALSGASHGTISIPYAGDQGPSSSLSVKIDVAPAVGGATSPLNASANAAAAASIGAPAAAPPGGRRTPPIYPSYTLIGRLTSMPTAWRNVANLMSAQTGTMGDKITQAVTAMLAATDLSTTVNDRIPALYQAVYQMVNNISNGVVQATVREFLTAQIRPLMDQQLNDLLGWVDAEAASHQTAVGTGTNAAPNLPPDPALAAAVRQMEQQARQMLNPAQSAAGQAGAHNVKFTVGSLMGANSAGESVRSDQMRRVADSFNSNLKRQTEENFTVQHT